MTHPLKLLALVSSLLATLALNAAQDVQAAAAPIPLRWGYYVAGRSGDSFTANIGNLDMVSPNFYRLDAQGNIQGTNRPEVTNLARARGVKVIPMIQNNPVKDDFNKLLSDSAKVKQIIDTIERQVIDNNYDGYHVDFEDLNYATEPLLTNFMRQLYGRLKPRGKLTTMAVVSRVSPLVTSQFSAAYNYSQLAPYLDLVTVMTYDYHYAGGIPGAVAPVDWQKRVMDYAAPLFGANKVLLGVPFYGYDWNLSAREVDAGLRAESRTFDETMQLQRTYNGTFGWDAAGQSPYLNYTKNGERHQVWFDNARSLTAKFDMMKQSGLRGFAAWRLGHEGAEFWPVIRNLAVPTARVPKPGPDTSYRRYFPETGHTLSAVFKRYWDTYGGLPVYGYPWTEEFSEESPSEPGKSFTVQYFERNRFEHHPEFAGTQYEVLLGLLGRQLTVGRENEIPFLPVADRQSPGVNFYKETGHTLRGKFKTYWEKNGGLALFGYPISEEFQELNPSDGKTYIVQYFERNRFELHPENAGTRYEILMGLLGNQLMKEKGWLQ